MLGMLLAGGALAGLSEQAPRGVNLTGVWRLDAARSADPQVALATVKRQIEAQKLPRQRSPSRGLRRDEDGDGPGERGGERLYRDIAIEAQTQQRAQQLEELADILHNPESIEIQQSPEAISLIAPYDHLDCEPGQSVAVTDSSGTGRRRCGWQGAALLVQLKRQGGSVVERRYELDATGQELLYTTTLSGDNRPVLQLRRVYRRDSVSAGVPAAVSPAH